ncbi:MAG: PEP-utilizing enzyme, partial [Xanthomonadales bacterium]|nr:PEP-utilizing enzyme [Xanthomonadales bacterium]
MSHRFEFNCPLPHGLHARPATAMAAFCEPFDARVILRNDRNGVEASAHSVLALISADIREGDRCVVRVSGTGSETVSGALQEWISKQLPHCDDELEADAVVSAGLPRSLAMLQPDYVGGSGLSTGIGLGQPVVLSGPRIPVELLELAGDGIDAEDRKLAAARVTAIRQVEAALATRGGAEAAVLRAHLAILQDEEYTTRLETAVREAGETAPAAAAVSAVVGHFDRLLAATGNPYLLERALDIRDVSMRLLGVIYGDVARPALPSLSVDSVVVADNLAPGDFIALRGERLRGLVLESGGRTSHTVLLARATGVPVLTGAANAVAFARGVTGPLVVDAGAGLLVDASKPTVREYYTGEQAKLDTIAARFTAHAQREARTGDGVRLEVSANIALPEEAPEVFANGAEGIGV